MPAPRPEIWARLLGASFLALVVGYALGWRDHVLAGKDIRNVVIVGMVSNGVASATLWISGFVGVWAEWSLAARIYMWGSAVLTLSITLCLWLAMSQAVAEKRTV